ncbi:hypothetical protein [Phycicoccus sp.]|mgnify:CR=1 FL=1|uniref:hypothetical protein n=1 Tax=Phycicoccus sp. TaxID=1902410 RepID=UPI002BAC8EE4|nr:hypothetical protein [Phycicoccus sp.]HMM94707.1 hypothetical protein [Phycicoccus sp.]
MGLRRWLTGRAVRATRVLVLECPGFWDVRVAAERALSARGWRVADSPASADVLLVAGPATGELAEVVERLWDALPGPRARTNLIDVAAAGEALDAAERHLRDEDAQRADAEARPGPAADGEVGGTGHESMDHESMDHGHPGHEGMDHGDMDMAPDGIPLAEGSEEDRDGLEMDELPLRLGPVLPGWPAGLVLEVTLHGDLVVGAVGRLVGDPAAGEPGDVGPAAARWCDDVASVLALAGDDVGASGARRARDAVLDGREDVAASLVRALRHRVEQSWTLRWSLGGAAPVTADRALEIGAGGDVVGDCRDRLLVLLDRAAGGARAGHQAVPPETVASLVTGLDLGVARLLVASLGSATAQEAVDA